MKGYRMELTEMARGFTRAVTALGSKEHRLSETLNGVQCLITTVGRDIKRRREDET